MRKFSELVFDDTIHGDGTVYTPARFNELLGSADQLALQVSAVDVAGPGSRMTVQIEHSSDGRYWSGKNGSPEISGVGLTQNTDNQLNAADTSANPSLGRGRLRILIEGNTSALVRIYACGRAS
jgi:hypothetical protein